MELGLARLLLARCPSSWEIPEHVAGGRTLAQLHGEGCTEVQSWGTGCEQSSMGAWRYTVTLAEGEGCTPAFPAP